jgi:DNA-binding MarR family transcriptional regulator
LTLPSVSKLVDGLVKQELMNRQDSATDRRRMILSLTKSGEEIVNFARKNAQAELTKILSVLPADELKIVQDSLEILNPLFGHHRS